MPLKYGANQQLTLSDLFAINMKIIYNSNVKKYHLEKISNFVTIVARKGKNLPNLSFDEIPFLYMRQFIQEWTK